MWHKHLLDGHWSRPREILQLNAVRGRTTDISEGALAKAIHRPFSKTWLYYDPMLNESRYRMPQIFPDSASTNLHILIKQRWKGDGHLPIAEAIGKTKVLSATVGEYSSANATLGLAIASAFADESSVSKRSLRRSKPPALVRFLSGVPQHQQSRNHMRTPRVATVWECALRKPDRVNATADLLSGWLRSNKLQLKIGDEDIHTNLCTSATDFEQPSEEASSGIRKDIRSAPDT